MPSELSPSERSLRARAAAYAMHAKHDTRETTRAARGAFARRFEDQVDPDRTLPEDERRRRAEAALKAYMTGLARRRSVNAAARKAGESS